MIKSSFTSEIFLASNYVSKENWNNLILLISKYMGYFKKWELIINIKMNEVRYFIISNKELPPTIGDMSEFLFKKVELNLDLKYNYGFFYLPTIGSSLIDIYDNNEIKYLRNLKQIRFKFSLLKNDKFLSKTKCIFENKHNNLLTIHRLLINPPISILSANYKDTRFFYKKKPKYLDIQKSLHLLKSESTNSILKVDTFPFLQGDYFLNQNEYNFDKHSLIIGGSGTGKSKLMSLLINTISNNSDYCLKYKIIVIDPHASIEDDIGGLSKSKILNFLNVNSSVDLFSSDNTDIVASTEMIISLFKTLIADQYNSKIERLLRYVAYILLAKKDFSFLNIRKLVLDTDFRVSLVKELTPILPDPVIDFFLTDFNELKTRSYNESIAPIVSFIDEVVLLPAFNNKEKLENIEKTIKDNFLTIFSLDRTKLGEKATKTIVGFALGQIMDIIQSATLDEHIILMIDEVPIIESPIMARFLSEARKYNLSLVLAGQYFNQISEDLRNSIFANISNYYVFRVSKLDATMLEENLSIKLAIDNTSENRTNLLANLNDRECIVRVSSNGLILPAIKAKTLDFLSKPKRKIEVKTVDTIVDVEPKDEIPKMQFSIESRITLNDLMIEQSTSRKKVR